MCSKCRSCGCGNSCGNSCGNRRNYEAYEDEANIFDSIERDYGPHTWKGYVYYDVEVEFSGPHFVPARRPESRNSGCRRNRGCGCN